MKDKITQAIKVFLITIVVAFIATDNQNIIYNLLDKLGYENDVLKKTILSAVITVSITLVLILSSYIWSLIKSSIEKMDVTLITKNKGRKKEAIKFTPTDYEYDPEDVEIVISFQPKGRLSSFLIKKIGVTLDVYFNPELLDVSYSEKWDCEGNPIFKISERTISIDLLGEIDIKGREFCGKSHTLNEEFKVKPIRVKKAETYLDYVISSNKMGKFGKMLSGYLLSINYETLKVNCEGEVN